MPNRRILSLWFPRLGAERLLRQQRGLPDMPFAVIRDIGQMQVISSLSVLAEARGLSRGQPLRDAMALCPGLVTRLQNPQAEERFLTVLRRWAGRFSPWVAEEGVEGLLLDITGCAHLFGGEEGLLGQVAAECSDMGLSLHAGIADTPGAAWALAHFAGHPLGHNRSGDAIDQEARATRSRAAKRRHWERGGTTPPAGRDSARNHPIAPPGQTHSTLAPLPVAALRLPDKTIEDLARLGLRRIGDLSGQPRAALARRFGKELVLRLDQAMGAAPEPISPARADTAFATRLTLPEPIGLIGDLQAAIDRLVPRLCQMLRGKGQGARQIRLQAFRTDNTMQWVTVGLARAADDPERILPLLAMKLPEIDAGFGIDMLRLEAVITEPLHSRTTTGHLEATAAALSSTPMSAAGQGRAMDDLIGRIGTRIGMEAITRRHPAESHLPEKTSLTVAAAWTAAVPQWPAPVLLRPLLMWRPEPVIAPATPVVPRSFRWRGRDLALVTAVGPERIAPEWWLDDPNWRSGTRDYWRATCASGDRLWLFFAHGAAMSRGWFCQGSFA